ncbi:MAG: hypothetical protein IT258_10145 [Saprospiraceae bacterium]|nr:hypothetical protein [Saprospiraceae bacterium]
MGNLTSCKIRVDKIDGKIDLSSIRSLLVRLQEEHNIKQNIKVFTFDDETCLEIRFGEKHYPAMINEIFLPSEYDVWIISSYEGGPSDYITYYPSEASRVEKFQERAIFKFDKIILQGDENLISENLNEIFGRIGGGWSRMKMNGLVQLELSGIYKSHNYFRNEYGKEIIFKHLTTFPFDFDPNADTELLDTIWSADYVDFRNCFYKEVIKMPGNEENKFPYLSSIQFEYKGIVTNNFEWKTNPNWNYWEHKAHNDFFNCVNTNYILHQELKKIRSV